MDQAQKDLQEKEAVLKFLGSTYGELKKLDGNIINPSSTLGRRSDDARKAVESFVSTHKSTPLPPQPADNEMPENMPKPEQVEVQQPQVQAQQPIQPIQQVVTQPQIDDGQLSFNFDASEKDLLFDKIDKITTRVDRLHHKVDKLYNQLFPPVKKQSKKKSVESKEEK